LHRSRCWCVFVRQSLPAEVTNQFVDLVIALTDIFISTNILKSKLWHCGLTYLSGTLVSKSRQSERRNYFLGQSGARPKNWPWSELRSFSCACGFMSSRCYCRFHDFLLFASATCFPALGRGCEFSRAWCWPRVSRPTCFLSFTPFTCFPAIYTIYALLSLVTVSYFPGVTTSHMILLKNSDWLIYHYLRKFLCFIPIRARPIVEMDGKIILSTKQISLEDNKTMRLASDRISRKRYPF